MHAFVTRRLNHTHIFIIILYKYIKYIKKIIMYANYKNA